MVGPAERHRELIACLATHCARLQETQVVRIRRLATAEETGLPGYEAQMPLVAIALRRADREHALVDPARLMRFGITATQLGIS